MCSVNPKLPSLTLLFIFIWMCFGYTSFAQNRTCGSTHIHQVHTKDATIKEQWLRTNHQIEELINQERRSKTSKTRVVRIPLVIHIIYTNEKENISDHQILSQIEVLNKDFRRKNADTINTPKAFRKIAYDVGIEFYIHKVIRVPTNLSNLGSNINLYSTEKGGSTSLDESKFINIRVCNLGNNLLGFATFPGASTTGLDGIVINYTAFGTNGTAKPPFHLGRTTTHEMGHYLGLNHLWGFFQGGCSEDDGISDTPLQNRENIGVPQFPRLDNCTNQGSGVMFMNYMDYVNDNTMNMFTQKQGERMRAVLYGPRAGLLKNIENAKPFKPQDSTNVSTVTPSIPFDFYLKISPNPNNGQSHIYVKKNQEVKEIHVYNLRGKEVYYVKPPFNNAISLNLSDKESGIYIVKITMINGETKMEKLIISKI